MLIIKLLGGVSIIKNTKLNNDYNNKIEQLIKTLDDYSSIAFTDGSYCNKTRKGGYGIVFITNKHKMEIIKSFSNNKKQHSNILKLHSVGAECEAVKQAIKTAIELNMKRINIFYDYEGIEKWINHEWNLSSDYADNYYDSIKSFSKQITIKFIKIKSHSNIYYNELADKLAKCALNKY